MVGVRFQPTPNPNAGKFVIEGRPSLDRPRTFAEPADAADDPLAAALLALDGVEGVFMVSDFVTVTKATASDWGELAPRVEEVIRKVAL